MNKQQRLLSKRQLAMCSKNKYLLEYLSFDKNKYIRCSVARNLNTSKETLEKLSNDKEYIVRYSVADNPNTSDEVLKVFKNDKVIVISQLAIRKLYSCLE